jgi:VIT1/CCC1 family predicted Fe2+/Mn2+ transporter
MNEKQQRQLITALESNWQTEMVGHYTYQSLAATETESQRRIALKGLSQAEKNHADLWAQRIEALGGNRPVYSGSSNGDAFTLHNRVGGPELTLRRLEIDESRDIAKYAKQLRDLGDEPSLAILRTVLEDEKEHYRTLSNLVRSQRPLQRSTPDQAQESLNEILNARNKGQRHTSGWVGDAIYGVNDGLGAIFGIVSGVSGATLGNSHFVLIAGLAGMIASALSMGSGAYLAAKSEREIFEADFAREREAVEYNEAEAREVLSLSYQIKGLPAKDADQFVEHLAKDREKLVEALARERLNKTEEGLSSPWMSAFSGALSTAVGALIPIVPFFFMAGIPAILAAAAISLFAHFAVGAAKSLITIRSWWASGLEMTVVGAIEGLVTYIIGVGLGRIGG